MIGEAVVLLRVERFEQRRAGIAAKVRADFVDFVEHEHRVVAFGAAQALNDPARQRSNIRAPVTANFGFIAHAAQR